MKRADTTHDPSRHTPLPAPALAGLLAVALLCSGSAAAQAMPSTDSGSAATRQTQQALELYDSACVQHRGDRVALTAWLDAHGQRRDAATTAKFFYDGASGTAWSYGDMDVSLLDRGECRVWVHHGDGDALTAAFEQLVRQPPPQWSLYSSTGPSGHPTLVRHQYLWRLAGQPYTWIHTLVVDPDPQPRLRALFSLDKLTTVDVMTRP